MKDQFLKVLGSTPTKTPEKINDTAGGDFKDSVVAIINGIIGALGIVAVVVIIVGGIGYMTSAGDPGKVKKAKDTILYGVIGLAICILSFAIVNFVIANMFNS